MSFVYIHWGLQNDSPDRERDPHIAAKEFFYLFYSATSYFSFVVLCQSVYH